MIRLRRGYGGQVRSSFALASYGGQVEEIKRLDAPMRVVDAEVRVFDAPMRVPDSTH